MHAQMRPYLSLALMATLSFLAMYILMYAMVDSLGNVYLNMNQLYMAGLMTAPMILIEMVLMRAMYQSTMLTISIALGAISLGFLCWFLIRGQTLVDDTQFLASMIPHHASAILMCKKAQIEDEAVQSLCNRIIENQQTEIDWMRMKLEMLQER